MPSEVEVLPSVDVPLFNHGSTLKGAADCVVGEEDNATALLFAVAAELISQGTNSHNLLAEEDTWLIQEVQDMLDGLPADQPMLPPVVLPPASASQLTLTQPLLPPSTMPERKTLVLDLDGTLIGSILSLETTPSHATPEYSYQCKDIWLRPGVRTFLQAVRPFFEVVLFTAASQDWANRALSVLDPDGTLFDHKLYREHTTAYPGWDYVKDLSRLGRDLSRVVIVDDNELMFQAQPCNAIWVEAWEPLNAADDVLEQVLQLLLCMVLPTNNVTAWLQHLVGVRVNSQQSQSLQYALLAAQALQCELLAASAAPAGLRLHTQAQLDAAAPATGEADNNDTVSSGDADTDADLLNSVLNSLSALTGQPDLQQVSLAELASMGLGWPQLSMLPPLPLPDALLATATAAAAGASSADAVSPACDAVASELLNSVVAADDAEAADTAATPVHAQATDTAAAAAALTTAAAPTAVVVPGDSAGAAVQAEAQADADVMLASDYESASEGEDEDEVSVASVISKEEEFEQEEVATAAKADSSVSSELAQAAAVSCAAAAVHAKAVMPTATAAAAIATTTATVAALRAASPSLKRRRSNSSEELPLLMPPSSSSSHTAAPAGCHTPAAPHAAVLLTCHAAAAISMTTNKLPSTPMAAICASACAE